MLYHFLTPLTEYWGALRLFNYITFRAAGAVVTAIVMAFLVGPPIIRRLRTTPAGSAAIASSGNGERSRAYRKRRA